LVCLTFLRHVGYCLAVAAMLFEMYDASYITIHM